MGPWHNMRDAPMDGTPILVWIEKPHLGSRFHIATLRPNVSFVGQLFSYDMPKMLCWCYPQEPPTDEQLAELLQRSAEA